MNVLDKRVARQREAQRCHAFEAHAANCVSCIREAERVKMRPEVAVGVKMSASTSKAAMVAQREYTLRKLYFVTNAPQSCIYYGCTFHFRVMNDSYE